MALFFGLLSLTLGAALGLLVPFYIEAVKNLKRAEVDLARYSGISDLEKHQAQIEKKLNSAKAVLPKFEKLVELNKYRENIEAKNREYEGRLSQLTVAVQSRQSELDELSAQAEVVEEKLTMQSFGFYRPKYGFEDSQRYSNKLDEIRTKQKALVKSDSATHCPQEWTVDGNVAKGKKMIEEHSKLMLRAFNGECDAAIGKVKYNNVSNLEARIQRSYDAINKLGKSKQLWITNEYFNAKLQELYLVHEHREKVQEEKEEQRQIKEQMREEERAQKEIEKAQKEAEKDEDAKQKALQKTREELAKADSSQEARLKAIVDKLETELKDALERKAKAIARAQLTRSGHVYVLSNIGTFGEGVYKIGMTRRLEPLDRVKELGDASVPFKFDVHAMIYSEDAPALENKLHQHFADRRVNLANLRREFFFVTLDEVHDAVKNYFGDVTFVKNPEAEEYHRSISIREEQSGNPPPEA